MTVKIPTKILYGKANALKQNDKAYGTILVNDYGAMKLSFTPHETISEAMNDAHERKELFRKLFSENVPATGCQTDVELYL